MNLLSSQIVLQIIAQQMKLSAQSVWLRDQNKLIPNDNGLYIVAGIVGAETISNITSMVSETVDAVETQHQISELVQREMVQVDVISRSNQAILRNWEVIAAMQSFYSQQLQELNNFKIFRVPRSFVNTSYAEGGSQLNRYTITIPCMVWYRKDMLFTSPLGDYYDDFTVEVQTESSIVTDTPAIEFEITSDTPAPPYP